jgi:hypothetical protein
MGAHYTFEPGDFSECDATNGTPTVAASHDLIGEKLCQCDAVNDFVRDNFSSLTAGHFRWYVKPNALSMTSGAALRLLNIRATTTVTGIVQLYYSGTNYQIRASILNDSAAFQTTSLYTIDDSRHYIEVAFDFAASGSLQLWIDGTSKETISAVDCDTGSANNALIGWTNTTGTITGTLLIDDYRQESTYIGPEKQDVIPTAIKALTKVTSPSVNYSGTTIVIPNAIKTMAKATAPAINYSGTVTVTPTAIKALAKVTAPTVSSGTPVPATDFDDGLHVIPYCWLDGDQGENLWQEMSQVVQSEGGLIYFDRLGTLVFKNREAMSIDAAHTTSQYTFTVSRFQDVRVGEINAYENQYNAVTVKYEPRALSREIVLFKRDGELNLLPGQSVTETCRLQYPALIILAPVAQTDYKCKNYAHKNLNAYLGLSYTKYAQKIIVTWTNNHATDAMIIRPFQFRGMPILGKKSAEVTLQATDSPLGDPSTDGGKLKSLPLGNNVYVQTQEQATALCTENRDRLKSPRSIFRIVNIPIIPWLEIYDRVTVVEATTGINMDCFILEIHPTGKPGVWKGDYVVIEVGAWYRYSDYFVLGVDTIGINKRVYY